MFPGSADARAQMKMVLGHADPLPDSRSFEILDIWRSTSSGCPKAVIEVSVIAMGFELAMANRSERTMEYFIFKIYKVGCDKSVCLFRAREDCWLPTHAGWREILIPNSTLWWFP